MVALEVVAQHTLVAPPNALAVALICAQVAVTVTNAVAKAKSSSTVQLKVTGL